MEKYGRLTILSIEPKFKDKSGYYRQLVKCQCDCGNIKIYRLNDIKSGKTKSCGCLNKEIITKHNDATKNRQYYYIYQLWRGIIKRCYNKISPSYKHYGSRGIEMYKPWINDYKLFKEWILDNLGDRPVTYSIDRINVDGHYEPDNLRWADKNTQTQNRRCTKNNG